MGSSTGNMLIDSIPALERLFAESPLLIATHCEDTPIINQNLAAFQEKYGEDIPVTCHPLIRSREACLKSSTLAASLARRFGSRLHILHLSTAEELALLDKGALSQKKITGEVCVHHLWFNDSAYREKGNFVRWSLPSRQKLTAKPSCRQCGKASLTWLLQTMPLIPSPRKAAPTPKAPAEVRWYNTPWWPCSNWQPKVSSHPNKWWKACAMPRPYYSVWKSADSSAKATKRTSASYSSLNGGSVKRISCTNAAGRLLKAKPSATRYAQRW